MKKVVLFNFLILSVFNVFAQIQIHSHNDYTRKQPLIEAYNNKADEIEADVFLVNGKLVVAHSKKEIDTTKTLDQLYLKPISVWFKQYNNRVNADKKYTFSLMIDVKDRWDIVYPVLKQSIEKYGNVFNRTENKKAIRVIISGNRPLDSTYRNYPSWLFFDGLPNINYSKKDLKKISLISDNFRNHSKWAGIGQISEQDKLKLKTLIDKAHQLNKPIRFWNAPDTKDGWQQLKELGVDIINTDKVAECSLYLSNIK